MNASLLKKTLIAAVVIATSGLAIGLVPSSIGQEAKKTDKANKTDKTEKKAKGRLPAYYADIVTEEQKERIYTIQAKHQDKITELTASLAAANKARDTEIEAVLTAEQKVKLKAAQDEAAAKKAKNAADKKAGEGTKKAAEEAKTTTKTAPESKTTKPK